MGSTPLIVRPLPSRDNTETTLTITHANVSMKLAMPIGRHRQNETHGHLHAYFFLQHVSTAKVELIILQ